jgi:hypothetical protein
MDGKAQTSGCELPERGSSMSRPRKVLLRGAVVGAMLAGGVFLMPHGVEAAAGQSTLTPGQSLGPGQSLHAPDGEYNLVLQASDGNLVLYDAVGQALWATGAMGGKSAVMQADGNFVVYNGSWKPIWATSWLTHVATGIPGSFLALQNDANLVLYKPNGGGAFWALPSGAQGHSMYYRYSWDNSLGRWSVSLAGCYDYDSKATWGITCPSSYASGIASSVAPGWGLDFTWAGVFGWSPSHTYLQVGANWDINTLGYPLISCWGRLNISGTQLSPYQGCDSTGIEPTIEALQQLVDAL